MFNDIRCKYEVWFGVFEFFDCLCMCWLGKMGVYLEVGEVFGGGVVGGIKDVVE